MQFTSFHEENKNGGLNLEKGMDKLAVRPASKTLILIDKSTHLNFLFTLTDILPWRRWGNLWRPRRRCYSGWWRSWEIQSWGWYRSWRGWRPHWRWWRPISIWYIRRGWGLFQRWLVIIIKCVCELSFLFTHFWTRLKLIKIN